MSGRETSEQGAMTKQAKSLRKGKFKPSRAPVVKASRAKGRRVKGKPPRRDPPDSFVDAAAHALAPKPQPARESAGQTNPQGAPRPPAPVPGFSPPQSPQPPPALSGQ